MVIKSERVCEHVSRVFRSIPNHKKTKETTNYWSMVEEGRVKETNVGECTGGRDFGLVHNGAQQEHVVECSQV